ncbi:MAG TPA: GNAT family N-acetyltransferase [Rhizomicrobium sp.]|nr:GNAT family N-acetyltransferase [Rhizomicrobium sp.]
MAVIVRRAEASDLRAMNALMHGSRAYQGEYYRIIENYFVTADTLEHNAVFVADDDGALLGFYSLVIEGEADLDLMFVSDSAQGLGVGRALFDHMKRTAREHGFGTVSIGSHPPSVGFYERMGAVRCGVAPPFGPVTWERPLLTLNVMED